MQKYRQHYYDHRSRVRNSPILLRAIVILIFACIGIILLTQTQAAPYTIAVEAESGNVSGNASKATEVTASGGSSVKMGVSSSTTPVSPVKPVIVGHQLQKGNTGVHLKMDGVTVWGIRDGITGDFGAGQYLNRQIIVNTLKAWGANHVRFRLLASDYNNQTYMTKAEYIKQVKEWRDLVVGAGMYFQPIWWDGLDGPYSKGAWGTQYNKAFTMMTDVYTALGDDPMVFYEPFNEPTDAPSDAQWLTAMKDTVQHFRSMGYTGILLIDMRVWSHAYNDGLMTQLEQYDATLAGMGGRHQLIFAKHDYANEGFNNPDGGFDSNYWANNGGPWDFNKHLVWETEFGSYNGSPSTVHYAWSQGAANWMAAKVNDGTLIGATPFVFGPWLDANAITTGDNITPTQWGGYARDFLQAVQ